MNKTTVKTVLQELNKLYPQAHTELVFTSPYELLIATMYRCKGQYCNKRII